MAPLVRRKRYTALPERFLLGATATLARCQVMTGRISPSRKPRGLRNRRAMAGAAVVGFVALIAVVPAALESSTVPRWFTDSETDRVVMTSPGSVQARGPSSPPVLSYPQAGPGTFATAAGRTPAAGTTGRLLRFRVAVEHRIRGTTPDEFATDVSATLGDRRSWTGGRAWRLQRVGAAEQSDFTILLVTPATRDRLCGDGNDRYTSCRNGDKVVINVARWADSVPHYGAPLAVYRQYVVNHEVGHRLGRGHERCPRRGKPAPLMQQQTLGLHGCLANPWVYLNGKSYRGPSGEYDDPVPSVR
jgi:hypothetical protein